jgi:predicted neuraminidase
LINLIEGFCCIQGKQGLSQRVDWPKTSLRAFLLRYSAFSADGDATYARRRNIAEGPGDFAYPIVLQGADGRIHAIYTSNQRQVINHAAFTESWLLGAAR